MKLRILIPILAVAAFAVPVLATFGGVESGLKVGDALPAYEPTHVSGPDANTKTCPVCKYGATPAVQVWVNNQNPENVLAIAKDLDATMKKANAGGANKFRAFVVFLQGGCGAVSGCCDNADVLTKTLKDLAAKNHLQNVAFAYIPNTDESLKSYQINSDKAMENTVLVYKGRHVTTKFVNLKADKAGLASLDKAVAAILK